MTMPLKFRQFYRLDGINLPQRFPVRVIWNGRGPFEAARALNPETGAASWVTYEKVGKSLYAVHLPCTKPPRDKSKPWKAWRWLGSEQPDFWAPVDPDKFKLFPLPPVALVLPEDDEWPRMWSSRQSFSAADAAQLAAEMDADREQARSEGKGRRGQKRQLWWLDVSRIRYSRVPGTIRRHDAEGRVMRALAQETLTDVADGLGFDRRNGGLSDAQLRELAEWEAAQVPALRPRFEQVQADLDDYDTAMSWFTSLGTRHLTGDSAFAAGFRLVEGFTTAQWVLFFASRDTALSLAKIAQQIRVVERRKISAVRVGQILKIALDGIWIIANQLPDIGSAKRADALEQLKEGNRRARGGL